MRSPEQNNINKISRLFHLSVSLFSSKIKKHLLSHYNMSFQLSSTAPSSLELTAPAALSILP